MRLWYTHIWKSHVYRQATAAERRFIEIRFTVARALKKRRRAAHLTQAELAARCGVTRNTISRLERALNRVSLDHAVRAMIDLGFADEDIANAFNAAQSQGIQILRRRAAEPLFPKPAREPRGDPEEHRFYRKLSPLPRIWE